MPKAIRVREEISGHLSKHSIIVKLAKSRKRIKLRKFQILKLILLQMILITNLSIMRVMTLEVLSHCHQVPFRLIKKISLLLLRL